MRQGACYIRVSTDDQSELSPSTQLREIQKYARDRGILLSEKHIFIDEGISGRKTKNRPAFQQMIGTAKTKPKPFDVILLWKFSRFARNQEEAIVYKSLLRKECGIEVISITEPVEDSPFGSLIERIIEWFDAYYSIRLGEDVKRSMTEKALRGEFQTGAPFGYIKPNGLPLQICEPEAFWVRHIFRQFAGGLGFFAIAKELNSCGIRTKQGNPFESRAVEYILRNPVYIGCVRWTPGGPTVGKRIWDDPGTITEKGSHAPIISDALWEKCRELFLQQKGTKKSGERPPETKKHWLSGLLKCGSCGSTLAYSAASGGFQCIRYSKGTCSRSHFISASKIEKTVYEALTILSASETGIEYLEENKQFEDSDTEMKKLQEEISRAENMLLRAKSAYLAELDTLQEYRENKLRIGKEIELLRRQLRLAEAKQDSKPSTPEIRKKAADAALLLRDPDISQTKKYHALRNITEKIMFERPGEEVTVYLYLRR